VELMSNQPARLPDRLKEASLPQMVQQAKVLQ
jgi:hypothetical protein